MDVLQGYTRVISRRIAQEMTGLRVSFLGVVIALNLSTIRCLPPSPSSGSAGVIDDAGFSHAFSPCFLDMIIVTVCQRIPYLCQNFTSRVRVKLSKIDVESPFRKITVDPSGPVSGPGGRLDYF